MLIAQHPEVFIDITNVGGGPLLTYVHTSRTPPGEVLDDAADRAEDGTYDLKRVRLLVLTDGGSPSPVARKKMIERLMKFSAKPQIAIVSDAPGVRFIVSTLLFFDPNVKVFSPRELKEALAFLQVGAEDLPGIADRLATMQQQTSGRFRALEAVVRTGPGKPS